MVYGRYNELVNGVYKPTYNWGAPHRRWLVYLFAAPTGHFFRPREPGRSERQWRFGRLRTAAWQRWSSTVAMENHLKIEVLMEQKRLCIRILMGKASTNKDFVAGKSCINGYLNRKMIYEWSRKVESLEMMKGKQHLEHPASTFPLGDPYLFIIIFIYLFIFSYLFIYLFIVFIYLYRRRRTHTYLYMIPLAGV